MQFYGGKGDRKWELKTLDVDERHENAKGDEDEDVEEFMQEIEGDKEMRANVKLYKKQSAAAKAAKTVKMAEETGSDDGEDMDEEQVRLDELLDELTLSGYKDEHGNEVSMEASSKIMSAEEAARTVAVDIAGTGFEEANFDTKDFKFL